MPMKASYYTVGGKIRGMDTAGSRVDLLPDALGSVVTATNHTGSVVREARYRPYGSDLAASGSLARPRFGWVGTHGYRETSLPVVQHYVRMRHYSTTMARWRSVDFLWPNLSAYRYGASSPVTYYDPLGLYVAVENCVSLSLPLKIGPVITVEIGGEFCKECFRPVPCCKEDPPYASICTSAGIKIQASFELGVGNLRILKEWIKKIRNGDISLTSEVDAALSTVMQMFQGIGGIAICEGLNVKDECVTKGTKFDWELCLVACLGVGTYEACVKTGGKLSAEFKYSFCGLPSVGVKGAVKMSTCV